MTDKELIQALREDAEWAHANEWETPITLGDNLEAAADRLEALLAENERLKAGKDTNVPTKWVSVSERLPELTYDEYNRIERCGYTKAPEFIVQIVGAREATALHFDGENWFDEEFAPYLVEYWVEFPRIPAAEQLGLPKSQH